MAKKSLSVLAAVVFVSLFVLHGIALAFPAVRSFTFSGTYNDVTLS